MKPYPSPQRISERMVKDLKMANIERINKGLVNPFKKNEISLRKITEDVTKTKSWQDVLKELKIK